MDNYEASNCHKIYRSMRNARKPETLLLIWSDRPSSVGPSHRWDATGRVSSNWRRLKRSSTGCRSQNYKLMRTGTITDVWHFSAKCQEENVVFDWLWRSIYRNCTNVTIELFSGVIYCLQCSLPNAIFYLKKPRWILAPSSGSIDWSTSLVFSVLWGLGSLASPHALLRLLIIFARALKLVDFSSAMPLPSSAALHTPSILCRATSPDCKTLQFLIH